MDNKVQEFLNDNFGEVRCFSDKLNNPWFCANDCLKILKYEESGWRKKISRLKSNGVTKCHVIDSMGRKQEMNFINEPNLFKLVFGSKMDKAEEFQDWICIEVIPQIRETGGYVPIQEEMSDEEIMAKALMVAQKTIDNKNKIIARQKEENDVLKGLTDSFLNGNNCYNVGTFAKIINTKNNNLGRNNLFKWLKENKILMNTNIPYQNMIEYFKVISVENKWTSRIDNKTLITPKGIKYIYKRLLKDNKVINKDFETIIKELKQTA